MSRVIRTFFDLDFATEVVFTGARQVLILGLEIPYMAGTVLWPVIFTLAINHSGKYRLKTWAFVTVIAIHILAILYASGSSIESLWLDSSPNYNRSQELVKNIGLTGLALISTAISIILYRSRVTLFAAQK